MWEPHCTAAGSKRSRTRRTKRGRLTFVSYTKRYSGGNTLTRGSSGTAYGYNLGRSYGLTKACARGSLGTFSRREGTRPVSSTTLRLNYIHRGAYCSDGRTVNKQ